LTTDASVHDSQTPDGLLDSAYSGKKQEETIKKYQMNNKIHEKGTRNNPLTEAQKESNRKKSKTRARVEHVFGFIEGSMNRLQLNCIGLKRASVLASLIILTNNMFRYEQLTRLHGIIISNY
jgi:IS5 family transposase